MEPLTTKQQIEHDITAAVLNQHKHRGHTNWYFRKTRATPANDASWLCVADYHTLSEFEAYAIADYYKRGFKFQRAI